jgi:hypothetical protein
MSIFEWLFESDPSQKTGSIDTHERFSATQPPIVTIIATIISIIVLGLPLYVADFPTDIAERWGTYLGIIGAEIIYLIIGFFVDAQPKTNSMGWMGGLIDNPFRISDDINRILFIVNILLLPGRLISVVILNFVVLVARNSS